MILQKSGSKRGAKSYQSTGSGGRIRSRDRGEGEVQPLENLTCRKCVRWGNPVQRFLRATEYT